MGAKKRDLQKISYLEEQTHKAMLYWVEEHIPSLQPFYCNLMTQLLPEYLHFLKKAKNTQDNDGFVYSGIAQALLYTIQEIFAFYSRDGGEKLTKGFCAYISQIMDVQQI